MNFIGDDRRYDGMSKKDSTMHLQDDVLELYLQEELESDFVSKVESHLRACESCSARLVEAVSFLDEMAAFDNQPSTSDRHDRRRLVRIATDDPATIQQVRPFSADRLEVRVLNISREGLRILSSVSLPPGTLIKIRIRRAIAFGVVRYCIIKKDEFRLGVFLQDLYSV